MLIEEKLTDEMYNSIADALDSKMTRKDMVSMIMEIDASISKQDAENLIREVMYTESHIEKASQFSIRGTLLGGGLSILAAMGAGFLWYGIVAITGFEIGYMAIGVGIATGFGAMVGTGGGVGFFVQIISSAASIFGILFAKYLYMGDLVLKHVSEVYGKSIAAQTKLFDQARWDTFWDILADHWGFYDFVWVFLAVGAAIAVASGARGVPDED